MIKVRDFIENAFSIEDAEVIFSEIQKELKKNKKVTIDFSSIDYYTTLFFNNAITRFVLSLGKEQFDNTFEIINLSEVGKTTYNHSLDNAMSMLTIPEDRREEVASILQKNMEEK